MKKTVMVTLFISLLMITMAETRAQEIKSEIEQKARMMERIIQYIEWPATSGITDKTKPFIIGFIGETPLSTELTKCYENKKMFGKEIVITVFPSIDKIKDCHVLFISAASQKELPVIIATLKNKPVLTIGDRGGFCEQGVHVNFYITNESQVRFEINPYAMKTTGLLAHKHLLAFARIVPAPKKNSQ